MKNILGKEWQVVPAGGATGEAYQAKYEDQKLFLKRNSSPFLAVLSAEGIVPKLLWTKRLGNGDVITAQQWLNGRELKAPEMAGETVAKLLNRIHVSSELLGMLKRLGKQPLTPELIIEDIQEKVKNTAHCPSEINEGIHFLIDEQENIDHEHKVVCHCDINHNNWLLSDEQELFLIDWDGAMIADPALDLGMLLHWYVPRGNWGGWLNSYGTELTPALLKRMHWYVVAQTIIAVFWHQERSKANEQEHWQQALKKLLEEPF